jgi:hypothetical protein
MFAITNDVVEGGGGKRLALDDMEDFKCGARVARHTPHVTRHTSHVTRHTSHVIRHTSHVTRHTSHVTHHCSLPPSLGIDDAVAF